MKNVVLWSQLWDNACTELTYFCSHNNYYISYPSYFKQFDNIIGLLCIKKRNTEIKDQKKTIKNCYFL